jgi:hypothetical protein
LPQAEQTKRGSRSSLTSSGLDSDSAGAGSETLHEIGHTVVKVITK